MNFCKVSLLLLLSLPIAPWAQAALTQAQLDEAANKLDDRVIAWRRDFHQHPELSNRETRTSGIVAAHLKKLGLQVRMNLAHTGVSAILRGGLPGPVIAIRADMDALPVTEQVDVPFKSTVKAEFLGKQVGVMHACGHDGHTAILMGIAEILASARSELPGTVLFIFQPAEEGPPEGEEGGAKLMMKEGLFADVKPAAIFGLHLISTLPTGEIGYRSGPFMASADTFKINIVGKQSHGAMPWAGVDPIVVGSQIVMGLQTIVSRQMDLTRGPVVVTVGKFDGGVRQNIVPETAEMRGTIRTFDDEMRNDTIERVRRTASNIAAASGATATLSLSDSYAATSNDPALTARVLPTLQRVVGADKVRVLPLQPASEDFSEYSKQAPAFFYFVGVTPPNTDAATAARNHSPLFYIDEPALKVAMRSLLNVAVDYLQGAPH
jgi:amidohydrolase